jgi:plastocyanin
MNKIILLSLSLLVSVFVLAGCSLNTQKSGTAETLPTDQATQEANTIIIKSFIFNPGTLTVKKGTKVSWINQDAMAHKIQAGNFMSSDLNKGDKFTFTFDTQGEYNYICSIHPSMKGKIVVTD